MFSYDAYGWLSNDEIPGRTTDKVPPSYGPKTIGQPYPNWSGTDWVLAVYALPPTPIVSPKSMPAIDFYRKIPAAVRIAIRTLAATDPVATDFMHTLDNVIAALGNVRQDDPDAVTGMAYLVSKGCLTQAQADALWA